LAAAVVFAAVAGTTIAALLRYVFGSIDRTSGESAAGLTLDCWRRAVDPGSGLAVRRVGLIVGALLALLLGTHFRA